MERLITIGIAFVWLGILFVVLENKPDITMLPAHDDITTTTLIVNWYATERELQRATGDSTIAGLSDCERRPEFNVSFCELWLVRPRSRNDAYTFDTIGHELCHALLEDCHNVN